ncbi:intermembrane phospholipid transport protein YdbH family protein [Oceanisphaera sp. KMM 10153]|uniref:intermembrane phospholipid transport protein YdbH family protein n=1 Tax=Oceanisphaera submarina TaxID=3390193 RepID=UPI003976B1C7
MKLLKAKIVRQLLCWLMLLSPVLSQAFPLPEWLQVQATLARAQVPACPREQAGGLTLALNEGRIEGRLERLSLDLSCSRSGGSTAEGEGDALSLLLTLPAIDFDVDSLTLYLSGEVITGAAELRHTRQHLDIIWHTDVGEARLELRPEQNGWRWQGELPGALIAPTLHHPLTLDGGWQPGQPLWLEARGELPAPLTGDWQLQLKAVQGEHGWQLQPNSQLKVARLRWKQLELNRLELTPMEGTMLEGPWRVRLSWQRGHWQGQVLPGAALLLSGKGTRRLHGVVALELGRDLQLKGDWHYDQGLALTVPPQVLSAPGVWRWLAGWLPLPVGLMPETGTLQLSLQAANLLDPRQPIVLEAELEEGRLSYRDMRAEQVAASFKLKWDERGLHSVGPQALSAVQFDVGVPITDIHAALSWRAGQPWLSGLTARAFGGRLALSPMALDAAPRGEVHLSDVSLEQVLGYAGVSGLTGSGSLNGRLPFSFEQGFSITAGRAYSDNGWISYQAGESLLATGKSNLSLGLTLGLLSDLRYQRLEADISMAAGGETVIDSRLRGQAPVMGKMHPVNFNYRHQENLLQLLASLRFAEELSKRLPARLQGESE